MKEEEKNISYSAEDIRKYLNGELEDRQMQAIEKAALEDPFLADAIEGMEEMGKQNISLPQVMDDLHQRLHHRITSGKRKAPVYSLFSVWKIAAVVVFILGLTLFTYRMIIQPKKTDLAKQTEKETAADTPVESKNEKSDTVTKDPSLSDSHSNGIFQIPDKKINPSPNVMSKKKEKNLIAEEDHEPAIKDAAGYRSNSTDSLTFHEKEPVVAAAPSINAKPVNPLEEKLAGKVSGLSVDASSDKRARLRQQKAFDSTALSEVVVTNFGVSRNRDKEVNKKIEHQNLQNVVGWEPFIKSLNDRIIVDSTASFDDDEEVVSFILSKDGSLSSFRVEQSSSEDHAERIISLIKTAPPLQLRSGKQQRIYVPMQVNKKNDPPF